MAQLPPLDDFSRRHLGPSSKQVEQMLAALGVSNLDELVEQAVPGGIRTDKGLSVGSGWAEDDTLAKLRELADRNEVRRTYIGMGYAGTITPGVILRNIIENPGWYTAYTPYQAEISQGRLEALLIFQTLIEDLTGMEIASASLLDEGTAAAEAMTLALRVTKSKVHTFFVSDRVHPQTIDVVKTRALPLGIDVLVGDHATFDFAATPVFGALVQYPATDGGIVDYADFCAQAHEHKALVTVACNLLALTLLRSPGQMGADIVVGNSQRFGVPLGYGGPHAAFMATRETYKRQLAGRLIGVSVDSNGNQAYRMALQTREQHIRRDRATSNICTAQVLLAVVAAMYGVYHGPDGLKRIAMRVRTQTEALAAALRTQGVRILTDGPLFDTFQVQADDAAGIRARLDAAGINLRNLGEGRFGISLDETVRPADLGDLIGCFGGSQSGDAAIEALEMNAIPTAVKRQTPFLTHAAFHSFHSETEMMRYLHRLEVRDLALNTSMIPLGSCTMKLNATAEMAAVTWPEFGGLHPFVPRAQATGYTQLFDELETWLCDLTGFHAVSLQPNAGSQGEYAGLLVIRAYHQDNGQPQRNVCLIPTSAHGTNPASAVMAGMKVVAVACDDQGNIDLADLRAKAEANSETLAALMVTYPSTHGVFETAIKDICGVVHQHGGQVYMDGANMNAMVGLCRPGEIGADVCHLNLHKTFCIPHGGGGPGMGPIGVAEHLAPFLPGHTQVEGVGGDKAIGAVSAAPWGSPSILPISWAYIRMMGDAGLTRASKVAILSANYIAKRLEDHYPVLYTGHSGRVAHECILDVRPFKKAGIEVADIAKRLMDYGFHAPTMSWPVAGTLMVEPTESESKAELDRFCDAMIAIHDEVVAVGRGEIDAQNNPLKHAPHTAGVVLGEWDRPYSREQAAFPAPWTREHKYWPTVGRVDNAYGDRNLVCACPPWGEEDLG